MTFKLIARCFWSESGKRLRLLEAERIKQPNGTRVNIQILYRQWIRQNEHNQKRFKSENCLVERQVLIPMIKKHWPGSYKPNGEKKKKTHFCHITLILHMQALTSGAYHTILQNGRLFNVRQLKPFHTETYGLEQKVMVHSVQLCCWCCVLCDVCKYKFSHFM